MKRALFAALLLATLLCQASIAVADDTESGSPSGTAQSPKPSASASLLDSAENTRAATPTVTVGAPTKTDPPAWRSVVAVLLGAAVLAGVALGTAVIGRENGPEDSVPDP